MINLICRPIDYIVELFAKLAAFLCLALVLLTAEQVIARYFFDQSSIAMQELEWHLFALVFLLAAPITLKKNEHVRVDIFYAQLSPKQKACIDIVGFLALCLPTLVVIIYCGIAFSNQALSFTNSTPVDYWSAKYFGPDGFFYAIFSNLEALLRQTILAGETSPDPDGLAGRWFIKACIPFAMGLLLLQAFAQFLKNLQLVIQKKQAD